ncbi:heavy-metal-associated domain-containing protein [Tenggerimyces flavus]|uniref:Heavy-metal-associated domain-containing protein n=1 Tax=Tenggerimyces flavus TaxID=1708749 RepID=A0ABV7Y8T4_9ACTN|nr:heavy-metal-associated domain-containing protein [Tenggerimyces flavus]MBM7791061.1 copper chaperone CopZ [Tenggerimyces flavus]
MPTATYSVSGLTCDHCVHAVTSEFSALTGVSEVTVDLVPGGESKVTVTSAAPLELDDVRSALDEAGDYQLVSA